MGFSLGFSFTYLFLCISSSYISVLSLFIYICICINCIYYIVSLLSVFDLDKVKQLHIYVYICKLCATGQTKLWKIYGHTCPPLTDTLKFTTNFKIQITRFFVFIASLKLTLALLIVYRLCSISCLFYSNYLFFFQTIFFFSFLLKKKLSLFLGVLFWIFFFFFFERKIKKN